MQSVQETIEKEFPNPKHFFSRISAFNMLVSEIELLYEENTMDMIIMGTQGASGLKEVLFGSNMIHVLKDCKCPLLAVPSDYTFQEPNELLFPSDYGVDFEERHIAELKNIASLCSANINVLHVSNADELTETQEKNRQTLAAHFDGVSHAFHTVQHHDISAAIGDFQTQSQTNFLAMLNNKRSFFENLFFGSKVKRIGLHLNTPFLVVPAKV